MSCIMFAFGGHLNRKWGQEKPQKFRRLSRSRHIWWQMCDMYEVRVIHEVQVDDSSKGSHRLDMHHTRVPSAHKRHTAAPIDDAV